MKTLIFSFIIALATLASSQIGADDNKSSKQGAEGSQQPGAQESSNNGSSAAQRTSETQISFDQLPAAVQKTFRTESGNLNVENLYKLSRNGQSCYVGTYDKGALKGQLTVGEEGSLLESVQAANIAIINQTPPLGRSGIEMSELPQALQSSLKKIAGTNKVGEISKVDHAGKTLYTAAFNDAGVHTELVYDEQGKLVLRTDQTALLTAPLQSSQKVSVNTVPKVVQYAIKQHASTDEVTDIDEGQWNGKTAYKVMIHKNGSARPILISENGEILHGQKLNEAAATGAPSRSEQGRSQRSEANDQEKQ